VKSIYEEGIRSRIATFETEAPPWEEWDSSHLPTCRLVVRAGDTALGWAALSPISGRCVYAGVAEVSVYVGSAHRGRGTGYALLKTLIECSEENGIWTLEAGMFTENDASIKLHRRCGFRQVGRRERIGKLDGAWCDIILMERRSRVAGVGEED